MKLENNIYKDLGIVIPSLNSAKTIGYTLQSLVPLLEGGASLVVVDSYSSDNTRKIVKNYTDTIIDVEAGNMYRAINAGIRKLSNKWVTYINSDDIIYADAVAQMLECQDADVIYGNLDFIDEFGRLYSDWVTMKVEDLKYGFSSGIMPLLQPGTIFCRSLWDSLDGFSERLKYSSDFDFFLRAFIKKSAFRKIDYPSVAAFRRHEMQFSKVRKLEMKNEVQQSLADNNQEQLAFAKLKVFLWRMSNTRSYLLRFMRSRTLDGKYTFSRSL